MYARVVRFTDVTRDRIDAIRARIEESDGPPPGVVSTGLRMLFDEAQGTAVFVADFATQDDLAAAEEVFGQMDGSDTPGTRVSVDRAEVVIERDA
jgi:hypothetical protein